MRAPEHAIPAPPFPRELTWVNVAPLRMDKQRGRPGARRVLGLLPRQLAAHAAVPEAWHERYADDGLRVIGVHTGGFPPARDTENVRSRRPSGSGSSTPSWSTSGSRCGTSTATRAGRRATCGTARARSTRIHYGEGAYQETEREIQALLGVERELVPPAAPRGRRGRPAARADRGPARRLLRPVRGRRRVGGARGRRARCARTAARSRSTRPAATRSSSTRTTPRACSTCEVGAGVTCHATCFTPGVAAPGARGRPAGG